jgi:hypothetical protein
MVHKKIVDEHYSSGIHLLICTKEEYTSWMDRKMRVDVRLEKGEAGHYCLVGRDHVMWIDSKARKKDRKEYFIHEAVHCAVGVLDSSGLEISEKNDEAIAYYVQWLYRKFNGSV